MRGSKYFGINLISSHISNSKKVKWNQFKQAIRREQRWRQKSFSNSNRIIFIPTNSIISLENYSFFF